MKIFYGDVLAGNTELSVTSEETNFEKGYLVDDSPGTKYRTDDIALQKIIAEITAKIIGVAYFGTNIVPGDTTFNFRAGNASPPTTQTDALTKGAKGYLDDFDYTYDFFSLEIVKASGTYIELGKWMLCTAVYDLSTARQENWGFTNTKESLFNRKTGGYGMIFNKLLYTRQVYDFEFEALGDTQKELFDEVIRLEPYVALYDDVKDEIFYGVLTFGEAVGIGPSLWNMTAQFTESV